MGWLARVRGWLVTREQRGRVERFLAAYGWREDIDDVIALTHSVLEGEVRAVRLARSQRYAIAERAHELAQLTGWTGSPGLMVERMLAAALSAAQESPETLAMLSATLDDERPAAAPVEPSKVTDQGRSADQVVSRSQARAEASEGVSGLREPRPSTSRGVDWGRDRAGHGPDAVTAKRDGRGDGQTGVTGTP